jgi:hypothetical protein
MRDIALYVLSGVLFAYAIPCIASDRWAWWRRSTTVKGAPVIWKARVFRCHKCDRIPVAGTDCSKPCSQCGGVYVIEGDECGSCVERFDRNECPQSKRWCGHHCNHVLTHDACDYCGGRYEEETWVPKREGGSDDR